MEIFDFLLVGIEASIALAGFAGIIASTQLHTLSNVSRSTMVALTVVVQFSFLSALACAIHLLLESFGVDGETLWAISSGFGAGFATGGAYVCTRNMRGAITKKSNWVLFLLLLGLGILLAFALLLNAMGLVFQKEPGPFIAGIIYALSVAGYMFSRLLLLPLWRIVNEQEAVAS